MLVICREMEEITSFVKGAICDDQCLGRCLYIHGVPGTGKVINFFLLKKLHLCLFSGAFTNSSASLAYLVRLLL